MSLTLRIFAQAVRDMRRSPAADGTGRALLAALLRHAAARVPRYHSLGATLEAAAAGDPDAWAALPVATRDDLARPDALAAALPEGEAALPPARSWTGLATPIAGPLGAAADIADRAQWEALAGEASIDASGRLVAVLPSAAILPGDLAEAFGPWSVDAHAGRANRWPEAMDVGATLAWLADIRPDCLFAEPGWVARLCAAAGPGRLAVRDVLVWRPAVGLTETGLAEATRADATFAETCRRVLGARLTQALASDLCGFIAYPCPCGGFSAEPGLVIAEIVDGAGRPCRTGEPGRLVATALHAYLRPAIRHDLGLAAAWAEEPRAGRRRFRVLDRG